jgi:hypothetical protein
LGSLFASGQSSGLKSAVSRLWVSDMIRKVEAFLCGCCEDMLRVCVLVVAFVCFGSFGRRVVFVMRDGEFLGIEGKWVNTEYLHGGLC